MHDHVCTGREGCIEATSPAKARAAELDAEAWRARTLYEAAYRRGRREGHAIATAARELISTGLGRIMNRVDLPGEAGSERRREFTDAVAMIWRAMDILRPDLVHPDDRAKAEARRAEILAALPDLPEDSNAR